MQDFSELKCYKMDFNLKKVYEQEINHFHKWWPVMNSFASIQISLTNLILKLLIQNNFYFEMCLPIN